MCALSLSQPPIVDAARFAAHDVQWAFARDGSLTAFDAAGRWWNGCSVPLLAAKSMLATLDVTGRCACFLRPTLAGHLRTALDKSRDDQAIISVQPDLADLRVLLGSADFSRDVRRGRLWFAWGEDWPGEMARLFEQRPGLPTPSQFIRIPTTASEEVEKLIAAAQRVFAQVNAARTARAAERRPHQPRGSAGQPARLCVVAPTGFRLWCDAGSVLLPTLQRPDVQVRRFDPDHPASAAAAALAAAAADCDAVVSADVTRADAPGVLPADVPWVTWVTSPRVPSFEPAGPRDALLVADPAWKRDAKDAGWPADRVAVAGWPTTSTPDAPASPSAPLAVIADTLPLGDEPPQRLSEFSSHLLLWNEILAEISSGPFTVGDDAAQYLAARMRRFGITDAGFDHRLFVERLIVPAYQQAVARALLRANVPLLLFGEGWGGIDEFSPHAGGAVRSRRDLRCATRGVRGLVHVWPAAHAHPIDAIGLPVLRPCGESLRSFIELASKPLPQGPSHALPPLRAEALLNLIRSA